MTLVLTMVEMVPHVPNAMELEEAGLAAAAASGGGLQAVLVHELESGTALAVRVRADAAALASVAHGLAAASAELDVTAQELLAGQARAPGGVAAACDMRSRPAGCYGNTTCSVMTQAGSALQVPMAWQSEREAGQQQLSGFVCDLCARLAQLMAWAAGGPPAVFWLRGFAWPGAFLSAVLQVGARAALLFVKSAMSAGSAWAWVAGGCSGATTVPPEHRRPVHVSLGIDVPSSVQRGALELQRALALAAGQAAARQAAVPADSLAFELAVLDGAPAEAPPSGVYIRVRPPSPAAPLQPYPKPNPCAARPSSLRAQARWSGRRGMLADGGLPGRRTAPRHAGNRAGRHARRA